MITHATRTLISSPICPARGTNDGPKIRKARNIHRFLIFSITSHFRYDDFSHTAKISSIRPNEIVTTTGTIESIVNIFTKSGKPMQKAVLSDDTGHIECLWYNQIFLTKILKPAMKIAVSGKANWFGHTLVLESPVYERTDGIDAHLHTGRLVPVYPETAGVTSKWIRGRINFILQTCIPKVEESLPQTILTRQKLIPLTIALQNVHFPSMLSDAYESKNDWHLMKCFFDREISVQKKQRESLVHAPVLAINDDSSKQLLPHFLLL